MIDLTPYREEIRKWDTLFVICIGLVAVTFVLALLGVLELLRIDPLTPKTLIVLTIAFMALALVALGFTTSSYAKAKRTFVGKLKGDPLLIPGLMSTETWSDEERMAVGFATFLQSGGANLLHVSFHRAVEAFCKLKLEEESPDKVHLGLQGLIDRGHMAPLREPIWPGGLFRWPILTGVFWNDLFQNQMRSALKK
jgi:hypothetical protein